MRTTIFLSFAVTGALAGDAAIFAITSSQWAALNQSVGGRLYPGVPMARPCFGSYDDGKTLKPNTSDPSACADIKRNKASGEFIAGFFGGYENANWGQCQATGASCAVSVFPPLDQIDQSTATCYQGSVPSYYVDARNPSDVAAATRFAAKNKIPLVVKNTGHDYKGRSSGPNSLAIWIHNIQPPIKFDKNFNPEGGNAAAGPTLTFGAGQQYGALFEAAHANGYMIVGGTSSSVGASGGYVQGGGHSVLSPSYGLAVDNVVQVRVVLADGRYVTANRYKNQDLFFALRGGGGGTFGVVIETTARVHKEVPMQYASISVGSANLDVTRQFHKIVIDNGPKWADEGWGGYIFPGFPTGTSAAFTGINPRLTPSQAAASLKPLTDFAASLGTTTPPASINVTTLPRGFYDYFQTPGAQKLGALNGISFAMASRLVPRANYATAAKKAQLLAAFEKIWAMPGIKNASPYTIFLVGPTAYALPPEDRKGGPGYTSVTPAWRTSVWHVLASTFWDPNDPTASGAGSVAAGFRTASERIAPLRDIAPVAAGGGAYQNEGDTFEPDPVGSFWGRENYDRLARVKASLDPGNVFTCHQCVGWRAEDGRYGCYPAV